jgi:hypothetical protein
MREAQTASAWREHLITHVFGWTDTDKVRDERFDKIIERLVLDGVFLRNGYTENEWTRYGWQEGPQYALRYGMTSEQLAAIVVVLMQ